MEDVTYGLYTDIAETRALPPRALRDRRSVAASREPRDSRRIILDAMTGKNRGYSFIVREIELDQRPCRAPVIDGCILPPERILFTAGLAGWMDP